MIGVVSFSVTRTVASETSDGKFTGARPGLPASAFGKCARVRFAPASTCHLTIRSSRPRVVASAMCFALRLHMSAAPPQGGLTQALCPSQHHGVHVFKIVKSLFGSAPAPSSFVLPRNLPSTSPSKDAGIEFYFQEEVDNSKYLRDGAKQAVLDHLLGKTDILKSGNKLSSDEKKALGINARLTITRELVAVLNEEAIRLAYPAAIITEMWSRATVKKSRHEQFAKLKASGVKNFKLMSCGDGNDCTWCQATQKKELSAQFDMDLAISDNCKCDPYCKCFIYPIVEF